MAVRMFLVDQNDRITKISADRYRAWMNQELAMPEYSNQWVRIAQFYGKTEDRRFAKVELVEFIARRIDEVGIHEDEILRIRALLYGQETFDGNAVSLYPARQLKVISDSQYRQTGGVFLRAHDWEPTQEQMDEFYRQMFPNPGRLRRAEIVAQAAGLSGRSVLKLVSPTERV